MKKLISLVLIALICVGLLVACGPSEQERLENAKTYLDAQMKNKAEATPDDYVVYDVISMNEDGTNVQYSVTWTVTKRDGTAISADDVKVEVNAETGETKIIVNKEAEADIPYTLTATIKNANGVSITTSYNRKVPKFTEKTHAEFVATANDEPVVVKGIINAIVNTDEKHELYMQDNDGGYYVYGLTADQVADLQVGQEIRVRGIKALYYGVHEVKDATIEVLNATPVAVEAKDITDAIANINDLTSTDATKYQSMYVKINGAFILGQISGNNTYYDVLVNGKDGALLQTYLRISGSANILSETDTTAFTNAFMGNKHKDATISGIVSIYGNQIYLIPCTADAAKDFTTVERNDAGKLAIEKTIMDKVYNITEAGKVTLQASAKTYTDVTFTWALTENDYVTLTGGNVLNTPVLPDTETTITLAVTMKSGEATEVKTYTLKVSAAPTVVADTDITFVPETGYVFFVNQKNIPQKFYWNGNIESNQLQVTTDPTKAITIKAKLVDGTTDKYLLYADFGGVTKYIKVSDNTTGKYPSVSLERAAESVTNQFKYNVEAGIFTVDATILPDNATATKVDTFYFGCYSTKDVITLSSTYYITGSKAGDLDVTQHPARFATLVDTTTKTDAEMVAREKADLDIKVDFATAGTLTLPVNGGLFGKVVITWSAATNNGAVVIENGVLTATPQDAEETVVVTATLTLGDATDTKTFNVVVSKIPTIVPVKVTTAPTAAGQYYLAVMKGGSTLTYLNGEESSQSYYLAITDDITNAVLFDVTPVTGGYTISRTVSGTTTYLNIRVNGTHTNTLYESEAVNVWTWDDTLQTLVVDIEGTKYGMANTSASYANIQAKPISTSGIWFTYLVQLVDTSTISDADKVATEKADLDITESIMVAGTTTLPVAGTYDDVTISYEFVGTVDSGLATLVDGVLTVVALPVSDTTVQIKATISCGDVSDEATFDVVIKAMALTSIPDANAAGTAGEENEIILEGIVVHNANTKYGNIYLADTNGNVIYLYGLKDSAGTVLNPAYGTTIRVHATTAAFKGSPQLANAVLVSSTEPTAATKVVVAWYALNVETSFDADATVTLPTSTDATIAWTLDGNAYTDATLAITQTSEQQTMTLVATVSGEGVSLTKTFNISVDPKAAEGSTTVTVSIQDYMTANSWTNGTQYSTLTMDDNITVTANGGQNTGKYYTSGYEWRMYQSDSGTITFTAAEGYTIASVKITYNISNTGVLVTNGTNVASGDLVTVNANTITFSVGNTGTATNGQAKITAIEVVYAPVAA